MRFLSKKFKSKRSYQSGQGMTEYILLIVVVIGVVTLFRGTIMQTVRDKMGSVSTRIQDFNPE